MYNGHADVTVLLTPEGAVAASYYYDAFGNILEQTGDVSNSVLFAGYQYDKETGLYYLNARMYDPVTARFMQEDTVAGQQSDPLSLNLYTYCHNSPLMYSDPTGHWSIPSWEDITDAVSDAWDATTEFANDVADTVSDAWDKTKEVASNVANKAADLWTTTTNTVSQYIEKAKEAAKTFVDTTGKVVDSAIDAGKKVVSKINDKVVQPIKNTVAKAVKDVKEKATEIVDAAIQVVSDAIDRTYEATQGIAPYTRFAMDVNKACNPWYWAFDFATEQGLFSGAFDIGGFYMDDEGIYHTKQSDSLQSWEPVGYNNVYDAVFNCATDMNRAVFDFEYDGKEYTIWAWKGDYLNLGAGAELGIYERFEVDGNPTSHRLVNQDLSMPMILDLYYYGEHIISYDPETDERQGTEKWWVTAFDPSINGANADALTAIYTLDFKDHPELYDAFIHSKDYMENEHMWTTYDDEENKYKLTLEMK